MVALVSFAFLFFGGRGEGGWTEGEEEELVEGLVWFGLVRQTYNFAKTPLKAAKVPLARAQRSHCGRALLLLGVECCVGGGEEESDEFGRRVSEESRETMVVVVVVDPWRQGGLGCVRRRLKLQ